MSNTYNTFSTKQTPQSQPIPGRKMVKNAAGGYVFETDKWTYLHRFLILGTEGGTFYVEEKELTRDAALNTLACIAEDGIRVVNNIVDISWNGKAVRNDAALFALALAIKVGNLETRQAAAAALPKVARIGTHITHFASYVDEEGWSRLTRRAISNWFNDMSSGKLAYQVAKYQSRDGWSMADLLRLAHTRPADDTHNAIYNWVINGWPEVSAQPHPDESLRFIWAIEQAKRATQAKEIIALINDYRLVRENIPTRFLKDQGVWEALLERMPLGATVRNLGKMTNIGLIKPFSAASKLISKRLGNAEYIHSSRLHPMSILVAERVYARGYGVRGSLSWQPNAHVIDALDGAFYLAFENTRPTGKRILLAVDSSGSMNYSISNIPLTARDAAVAMALITTSVEPDCEIVAFTYGNDIRPLPISPRQRLGDAMQELSNLMTYRGTDCALPALYAQQQKMHVDAIVILTDNETWAGKIHPSQAMAKYRKQFVADCKFIEVALTPTGQSISDPQDVLSLDVVGFDTSTPQVINSFIGES